MLAYLEEEEVRQDCRLPTTIWAAWASKLFRKDVSPDDGEARGLPSPLPPPPFRRRRRRPDGVDLHVLFSLSSRRRPHQFVIQQVAVASRASALVAASSAPGPVA